MDTMSQLLAMSGKHKPPKPRKKTVRAEPLRAQIRALVMEMHRMRPTRRPVTLAQQAAWRRFQKAMGGDGYWVEYASVGEIADAVVDLILKEAGKWRPQSQNPQG